MKKIFGVILIFFGVGVLLSFINTLTNDWPMTKILFVGGIQLLFAVIPMYLGIRILKKNS